MGINGFLDVGRAGCAARRGAMGRGGGGGARDRTAKSTVMITNRGQLRKNVERAMRKLFDKKLISVRAVLRCSAAAWRPVLRGVRCVTPWPRAAAAAPAWQDDPKVVEQRQIDFAWTLVDWRTFDPGGCPGAAAASARDHCPCARPRPACVRSPVRDVHMQRVRAAVGGARAAVAAGRGV